MGIFAREPTIGNSNLTQSDLDRLLDLDDTYRTDYTYVTSRSYRLNGSDDYETPRMSRLPLNYYRRKWAYEKARKTGLLYYMCFCACNFASGLMPRPLTNIFNIIISVFRFIIHCLWYVINGIFPNPEHFTVKQGVQLGSTSCLEKHKHSSEELEKVKKSFRAPFQETVWHSQLTSSSALANKLGQSFTNMITLGYFSKADVQGGIRRRRSSSNYGGGYDEHEWRARFSFSPVHDLTPNVQRRVRTSSYEYSEDRGTEINKQSVRTMKVSKGLMESLLFKLFYLTFMAALSPIKIFEFTIEKIAWIGSYFSFSHSTYNLRSRTVNKNLPHGETLPYTNRFASFLSEIVTSCFIIVFLPITKLVSLPLMAFSCIFGQSLGSVRLQQSLQQQTAGSSSAQLEHYLHFQIFRFLIDLLYSCATGFIFFLVSVHSLPFYIAENVRERVAYALANVFGLRAALLVGYEEVRQVKRKKLTANLEFTAAKSRQKMVHKSQLFPTRGSVKYSTVFWKWLFPLLVFLLLLIMFHKRHDSGDDLMVGGMELFGKIQQSFFDGWKQKVERGLNLVLENALYLLFVIFRFLYDLFLYPAKLCGAIIHSERSLEQVLQLPKYVIVAGQSVGTKAVTNICSYFLCRIPTELYSFVGCIFDNIGTMVLFIWKLISSGTQILLTLPSSFISIIAQFMPFSNQKTEGVISSEGSNDQQAEWTLEHLRHEKELLELKVLQLRRERQVEEDRYKNIHKALRLIGRGSSLMLTDKQLKESSLVEDQLLQHRNNQDPLNYVTNLRKSDDEELERHLLVVERRLMKRLDILSEKIENEIAQKIIRSSQQSDSGRSALSNELSDLSSAVRNLRAQFDKELSFSLSRFEKASHEEREAFRLEIMKAVENRVVTLFASHIAKKSGTVSDTELNSVLGLSESDFVIIKKMITDALDTYDADKTGKVDYALESSGASVVSTRCTKPYKENSRLESVFGIPLWYSSYSPRAVIQHRPLAAGECWAFRGKGYLTIKLSHPIYVTEVSYEHLHSTLHPDGVLRSAPKLFQVYSYEAVDDLKSKSLIGQYEYDIKGRALQTFHAQNELNTPVSIVELVVQSNWDSDYTCLYRFRVHGQKA
uniref:BMA-UNC-84; SUN domain-containing protein n=1 Tax=Brugia malayi TaxID=6279 RepID=A0A7I4KJ31_BRUMA